MVYRFGPPADWPTYSTGAYALSFSVSTLIFIAAFYFGGLYEREPRLGGAAVLPRAARLSLAAGSFVALLNLALTGLAQQRGSLIERALPFPIRNLVFVMVLVGHRRDRQPGDGARPAHPARGTSRGSSSPARRRTWSWHGSTWLRTAPSSSSSRRSTTPGRSSRWPASPEPPTCSS